MAGLILLDPALPFVLARPDPLVLATFAGYLLPGLGRLVPAARRPQGPDEVVASILRLCCADPARVTAGVIARHLELARRRAAFPGLEQDFLAATRSVVATMGYPGRRVYRRRMRTVSCPVLLIHGTRDRLVPVTAARAAARANPCWTLIELPGTGHVPQLEAPGETAQAITGWLGSAGPGRVLAGARPAG